MSERTSTKGDFGVNWDADARRAYEAPYPYTDAEGIRYLEPFVKPNDKLLEVGAQIASWLWAWRGLEPTLEYTGFDWSRVARDLAMSRYGPEGENIGDYDGEEHVGDPINFIVGDARQMKEAFRAANYPFLENFDIVFTHTFYQHTNIETKKATVPQVYEALKPGGYHIIQENTSYDSDGTWKGPEGWVEYFKNHRFIHVLSHEIPGGGHGIVFQRPR